MRSKLRDLLPLLLTAFLLITVTTVSSTVTADQILITLDGVRDAGYVQIASDPAGDLASPGPADWTGT
jgi:hypothetical protein